MKLKKLLKDLPFTQVKGSKEIHISGVCANSKLVAPGNLFVARKGKAEDGSLYIPEAVAAGAVAVLTDIYDPLLNKDIVQLIHPDVAAIEGKVAAHYYQFPSSELYMVGITGTNGKTTTSFIIKHLMDKWAGECGLIGTIEYIIGKHRYRATRTTPDVSSNQKMLREMILQGCSHAVMEVTSHALEQGRVDHIDFDVAVFTNLTPEHLDYHHNMASYAQAKNKLFLSLDSQQAKTKFALPKKAVVNADSPWHRQILEGCKTEAITYSLMHEADLMARDITLSAAATSLTLDYRGQKIRFELPLVGRFNVYNCLAAAAVGLCRGIPLKDIAEILSSAPAIAGRLEPVPNDLGLRIYVDYAHTDDALINVLECLKELKETRIITVFGCGGDRDTSKRPRMAAVCEQYSDLTILTSDNPRSENPLSIAKEAIAGFSAHANFLIELNRKKAIELAIGLANPQDIVLIAGKGHETYQIFAHQTIEFDDYKETLQICKKQMAVKCTQ